MANMTNMKVNVFHYLNGIKGREMGATLSPDGPNTLKQLMKAFDECCVTSEKMRLWKGIAFLPGMNIQKKVAAAIPHSQG